MKFGEGFEKPMGSRGEEGVTPLFDK